MNKDIRLLVATGIYPPSVGGPATYSKLLNDELPKRNVSVKVVSFDSVRSYPKIIRHFLYMFLLFRNSYGVTHIYAQDPVSVGLPACIVSFILRKKFWIRVAGDYAWEQSRQRFGVSDDVDKFQDTRYGFRVEMMRFIQCRVVRWAERVITPSAYFSTLVSGWLPESRWHTVVTIYNGIDLVPIVLSKEQARKKLGIPEGVRVAVSAGRLVPWKGFDDVINTLNNIDAGKDTLLYILGDGPERSVLEDCISRNNLHKQVFLMGDKDRQTLLEYLIACDMFVLFTSFESFSFQTVEAMHAGVPVVVTDTGSLPELVTNTQEGLLVEPSDTQALGEAMSYILEHPKQALRMGKEGQRRARNFSIERVIDSLINELQQ